MTTELTIRDVARADLSQWRRLWDGYNAFYDRAGPTALPEAITLTTWDRFFDPGEPMHALVAERGTQLVGLVHYIFHRSTTLTAPICYLQDLFVDERVRGSGAGRALIEAVYERARQAGSTRVYWQTHETNITARRLYDRIAHHFGFIVYREDLPPPGGSDA